MAVDRLYTSKRARRKMGFDLSRIKNPSKYLSRAARQRAAVAEAVAYSKKRRGPRATPPVTVIEGSPQ